MEDYCTFEQAVKLKELGFDWNCIGFYNHYKIPSIEHCILDEGKIIKENYNDDFIANTYNILCSAPTLSQAAKWLREVKDIIIGIDFDNWCEKYGCHIYKKIIHNSENIKDSYGSMLVTNESNEDFNIYEEALSKGIDTALELLNQN